MTDAVGDNLEQDATPVPVRYWWLKRLGVAGIVFVLALGGLRVWWGWVGESRLQAKIAEYRAAGEPIALDYFAPPAVSDAENGASFLTRAGARLTKSRRGRTLLEYAWEGRWRRDHLTELRNFADENQQALGLLHAASACERADWNFRLSAAMPIFSLPNTDAQRELAGSACVAALVFHESGEDRRAVETLCDMLAQARHVSRMAPNLLGHFAGTTIERRALDVVESMAGSLRIGDESESAERGAVDCLMRALLDRAELDESWRWCLQGERSGQLEMVLSFVARRKALFSVSGSAVGPWEHVSGLLFGPAWKLDAIRMLGRMTATIEAGTATNWPVARGMLPEDESGDQSGLFAIVQLMSSILMPSLQRATELEYRLLASQRMAATALAIRLYELDHGRRPGTLDELVPEYLTDVPRDPFDGGDGPLRYAPDAAPARLYSIGPDGVDDGGAFVLKSDGGVDEGIRDQVFFLEGERPRRAPQAAPDEAPLFPTASEQAIHDGADVQEAEGEQKSADEHGKRQ